MEQVERRLSLTGLTIDSDPSLRMQMRPVRTGIAPGAGKPREDLGLSGFSRSPQKHKLNKTSPASTQSTPISIHSSGDDDDIDLFDSRARTAKIRTTTASGSRVIEGPTGVTYKGEVHEYHPEYLPKPKLPSFKKNKPTNHIGDGGDDTSSRADTPDQPQQSSPPLEISSEIPNQERQVIDKGDSPTPPPRSSQPSSTPPPTTRPKRPRPRPKVKPPRSILKRVDSSDNSDNPVGDPVEEEEVVPTGTKERPKATKKQPGKYAVMAFPLLNDPSFQSDQPLGVASNLSPCRSRRSSPEVPPVRSRNAKGGGRALAVSDDDTEDRTAPQPFPLSTSFMNSTPKASKRHPEDETHSGGSERKKLKESLSNGLLQDDILSIGSQNPDFFFLDPNVDPSTLCPWCDQQLPTDPTPRLKSLIESVRSKSYSSPRPSNPLGLGAPLTSSVTVCQRHRFESHQIPKAQAKGWPTKIDFGQVKPRVEALRSKLEALILNTPSDADNLILLDEDDEKPRDNCPFWMEMVKEVKSKGTRAVASSKGQFANFKAFQPGYYGELGYLIVHQTIYQLFPPDTIDPDSTVPLTPSDFIQRILVPEAAAYLIMEDLQSTYLSAIKTLRESVEYGVAMFPDTGGDNEEGMKAADDVVKERARVRRKQLLEEEMEIQKHSSEVEVELEISRLSSPPKPTTPKKSRFKRSKAGVKLVTETSESERDMVMVDLDEPQILTQRPPVTKSRKPTSGYRSDASNASNASNASVASRASTRSMTRKRTSKVNTRVTQSSDPPPPLPASQPPKQQNSTSSYRANTPSDHSSDVEVISDHSTRSTRSHTRKGTRSVPQPPPKNSKSVDKRSTKSARIESTLDTDSDDELLGSSPFSVGRHLSQRTLSVELEDLDVDETPKPQKIGSMKLNPDPWGIVNTPTRQSSHSGSQSSQNLAHLLDGDEDIT